MDSQCKVKNINGIHMCECAMLGECELQAPSSISKFCQPAMPGMSSQHLNDDELNRAHRLLQAGIKG
jgi:hypothetical protein